MCVEVYAGCCERINWKKTLWKVNLLLTVSSVSCAGINSIVLSSHIQGLIEILVHSYFAHRVFICASYILPFIQSHEFSVSHRNWYLVSLIVCLLQPSFSLEVYWSSPFRDFWHSEILASLFSDNIRCCLRILMLHVLLRISKPWLSVRYIQSLDRRFYLTYDMRITATWVGT